MADEPTPPVETPLPESLRRQLDAFRRELWRTKIAEALLAGLFGLLASFLLVFALDRLWPTPGALRLLILIAGISLLGVFAPWWLHRWVWRHRREGQLARLIARRFPGLGDRLLGVVELQQQVETADTLSPRLRAAAMEAVAAEAERRKLDAALPVSRHRRWSLAVAAFFLLAGAAIVLTPKAGLNSLKRWLLPLSETPRYTFTRLHEVPAKIHVPQGETFRLSLQLADDTERRPEQGRARYAKQDPVFATLDDENYGFDFPGQQDPGVVHVEIGDARHAIEIVPSLRPAVRRTFARLEYPDYLQLPDREIDLGTGVLPAVHGSRIRISIDATRPLVSAAYSTTAEKPDTAMEIEGTSATTAAIEVGEESMVIPLEWTDALGLDGGAGFQVRVDAIPDAPPVAYIQGMERQRVLLPEETIDFEALAEDDHGIRELGLEWHGEPSPGQSSPSHGELKLAAGAPAAGRLAERAAFSPAAFGIGAQKLLLSAYVEDYLPGRGRVYSQPVTLYILTRDEHAQMLKNQFDRIIGELEDIARLERNLFEENQRLERLDADQLQDEEARKRLHTQEDAERRQAERMQELTERIEELFKDSTRNGTIDKETLRKMAEAMQAMRELSQEDLPGVEQKLGEAGDQRSTPEKASDDMQDAVERQREALEKMQEAIENANDANDRFEAGTFVNRLKRAASEQEAIASALIESYSRTLGMRLDDLDPSDSGRLNDNIRQQSNTASDVRWIQEDLGHFLARTDKPAYREILGAMTDSRIDLGLEDIRARLSSNHAFTATEGAKMWAAKLAEWAKILEGGQDANGGGGEGGASPPDQDEDFEFMLRVMRMIQQEQDIRARTRALETLRRSYDPEHEEKP